MGGRAVRKLAEVGGGSEGEGATSRGIGRTTKFAATVGKHVATLAGVEICSIEVGGGGVGRKERGGGGFSGKESLEGGGGSSGGGVDESVGWRSRSLEEMSGA